jgi:MoaA/NifB/PqqE/SkfB family radical SAM enzyme
MKKETEGTNLVEQAVEDIFRGASQFTLYDPSLSHFSLRTLERQTQASRLRSNWRAAGVPVPPAMMMSITDRCNLRCQGCAAQAHQASPRVEMEDGKIRSIFVEARELGISIILLIGGEPLIRKEILNTTRDFAEIIFLLFSNGLLIDENLIVEFGEQNNIIPVLSLEGYQRETDGRRGKGVYQCLRRVMGRMEQGKIFWGVSFTLTRFNFDLVTDALFIKGLVAAGCRLFFFVEFNPMNGGLQDWILTKEQRGRVLPAVNWLARVYRLFEATI